MKSPLVIVMGLLGGLLAATAVQAQTRTPSASDAAALTSTCSGFLEQSAGGVSGDHAKLCACLVRETPSRLSLPEMQAYAEAAINNRAPPDAVMQKMTAIATLCLREAQ
jgi:hypothetical protein